jgi:hypothetical protein
MSMLQSLLRKYLSPKGKIKGTPLLAVLPKTFMELNSNHKLKLRTSRRLRIGCWLSASLEGVSQKSKGRKVMTLQIHRKAKGIGLGRYRL